MSVVSNKNDVVFGSVFSGRQTTPPGSEQAVGMLMNTLPFRVDMNHESSQCLFKSVKETLLGCLSHEHFSLNQAKQLTELDITDSLVNGMLNFRRGFDALPENESITLLDDEDKMVPTSPLIAIVTDESADFYVTMKVDSRINMAAVWSIFKTVMVNLLNDLGSVDSEVNLIADLNCISNTSLLIQGSNTNETLINESSFIAVELRKIWNEAFGFEETQVSPSTSFWECGESLNLDRFVQMLNGRFDTSLDRQSILINHTFWQQVSYITQAFISGVSEDKTTKDSTEEYGVI
jgi:hypothetical protein